MISFFDSLPSLYGAAFPRADRVEHALTLRSLLIHAKQTHARTNEQRDRLQTAIELTEDYLMMVHGIDARDPRNHRSDKDLFGHYLTVVSNCNGYLAELVYGRARQIHSEIRRRG